MTRARTAVALFLFLTAAPSCKVSGTVGETAATPTRCRDAGANDCETDAACTEGECQDDDHAGDAEEVGEH